MTCQQHGNDKEPRNLDYCATGLITGLQHRNWHSAWEICRPLRGKESDSGNGVDDDKRHTGPNVVQRKPDFRMQNWSWPRARGWPFAVALKYGCPFSKTLGISGIVRPIIPVLSQKLSTKNLRT